MAAHVMGGPCSFPHHQPGPGYACFFSTRRPCCSPPSLLKPSSSSLPAHHNVCLYLVPAPYHACFPWRFPFRALLQQLPVALHCSSDPHRPSRGRARAASHLDRTGHCQICGGHLPWFPGQSPDELVPRCQLHPRRAAAGLPPELAERNPGLRRRRRKHASVRRCRGQEAVKLEHRSTIP